MLKYTISSLFILVSFLGMAQSEPIDLQPKDTITRTDPYGIRFGVDLSRLGISFLKDDYQGIEFIGDYRLTKDLYLAAEIGNEKTTRFEDLYNHTVNGSYIKLGVDLNTYENWYGMNNSIFIGARYAVAAYSQTLNDYKTFSNNRYWSPTEFVDGQGGHEEITGLNASWLEMILGLKAELFANIYLGASVRLGVMFGDRSGEPLPKLWVPGFNKVTDGSRFGSSYNYSLTYFLPLYKKVKKKKEEPAPVVE